MSEIGEYLQARRFQQEDLNCQLLRLEKVGFRGREHSRPQVDVLSTEEEICRVLGQDLTLVEDVKTKREAFPVEEGRRSPRRLPPPSIKEERQAEFASLNPGFYSLGPSTPQKLTTRGGRRKEG